MVVASLLSTFAFTTARAEDKPVSSPTAFVRQGAYVNAGLGVQYEWGSAGHSRMGGTTLFGQGLTLDLGIGHSVRPNLALALDLGVSALALERYTDRGWQKIEKEASFGARAGVLADYFSSRHIHWMGGVGLVGRTLPRGVWQSDGELVGGLGLRLGVGYQNGPFDARLRVDTAVLGGGRAAYLPVSITGEIAISTF
jgi:hypothetical protein